LAADELKPRGRARRLEHPRRGESVCVCDLSILRLTGHLRGRNSETVETRIDIAEGRFDRREVEEVGMYELPQPRILNPNRTSNDHANLTDTGIGETRREDPAAS
jgi:hypothetical protein